MSFFSRKHKIFVPILLLFLNHHAFATIGPDDIREIRTFVGDIFNPDPVIKGSSENPQRLVFEDHLQALKLLVADPMNLKAALGTDLLGDKQLAEMVSYFKKFNDFLKENIGQALVTNEEILDKIKSIGNDVFTELENTVNSLASSISFDKLGLEKLALIKVDGMGKIGDFILEVLKNYHKLQSTMDKRFIIATYLRTTMPDDPIEKKFLAINKASGPFFHKIIQLVGDFIPETTAEGKRLKETLNEVKRSLLPINSYDLDQLIKRVEQASGNRFKISVIKTLGVASVGHALLVNLTDQSGKKQKVVLKFIKPGVKARAYRDIDILKPIAERLQVLSFLDGTINDILAELDFSKELKNLKMADEIYNSNDPNDPIKAVTSVKDFPENSEWIAMTLAPGKSFSEFGKEPAITDEQKIDRQIEYMVRGIALEKLASKWMLKAFFDRKDGFYHGDLHAGNILINIETDKIKTFLRNKYGNIKYNVINEEMAKTIPTDLYQLSLIDFGNASYLKPNERQHILNFLIATLDEVHSWDGFYDAYINLIDTKFDKATTEKLQKDLKQIFADNKNQADLLSAIFTIFLGTEYPPLPPVMANFGRSQAMLNNIFVQLQNEARNNGLSIAYFVFSKAIVEDLIKLLAAGTILAYDRVDTYGNRLYLNTANILSVVKYGADFGMQIIKSKLNLSYVPLSGKCSYTTECQNWSLGGFSGVACCNGTCKERKKNRFGLYLCPAE